MKKLPEYVYLVTVENEWPVTAIAADHPSVIDRIAEAVRKRTENVNGFKPSAVRVWRIPVGDAVEVEVVPASVSLRIREAAAKAVTK